MKAAIIILSIIVLVLLLLTVLLGYLVKEKTTKLREHFTADQVMNAWCALYHDKTWEYHSTFFKENLSVRDFLMTARLGSKKLIDSFNDRCRSINRIIN